MRNLINWIVNDLKQGTFSSILTGLIYGGVILAMSITIGLGILIKLSMA